MKIDFDFKKEESGIFGKIYRPITRLFLIGENKNEVPEIFYVDSGADITLIPRSLGELLGFTVKDPSKVQEIKGIGERGVPFILKRLKIKFDGKTVEARVAWCLIEEVPPLLGRLDIFELFNITFKRGKVTIFED